MANQMFFACWQVARFERHVFRAQWEVGRWSVPAAFLSWPQVSHRAQRPCFVEGPTGRWPDKER